MTRFSSAAAFLVLLGCATAAHAQNTAAPSPSPLIIERVHNGVVIAPDYKVTSLDGDLGQLAGGYVARVIDDRLIIGGAGYWMVDGSNGAALRYGGLLVGWSTTPGRIRFGGRALAGVGHATLPIGVNEPVFARFGARTPPTVRSGGGIRYLRAGDDILVLEPQASGVVKLMEHVSIDGAIGYRVVGLADALRDRLDGVTGSLALQFGW